MKPETTQGDHGEAMRVKSEVWACLGSGFLSVAACGEAGGSPAGPAQATGGGSGGSTTASDASYMGCETCGTLACIDFNSDSAHCGGCGQACPSGAHCEAETCVCPSPLVACASECVDPQTAPRHCGGCGHDCGGTFCRAAECVADCGELTACDQSCVDLLEDDRNCGACGEVCGTGTHCAAGDCQCGEGGVSFAADIQPILTRSCASAGCHDAGGGTSGGPGGGGGGKSSLDLTEGSAYDSLLSATTNCGALVASGEPDQSVLLGKLDGTQLCGGTRMPKGADPLPEHELGAIASWICQGALDN